MFVLVAKQNAQVVASWVPGSAPELLALDVSTSFSMKLAVLSDVHGTFRLVTGMPDALLLLLVVALATYPCVVLSLPGSASE